MLLSNTSHNSSDEVNCSVNELSPDLKRMLSVQFKEFIHHIEDQEYSMKKCNIKAVKHLSVA